MEEVADGNAPRVITQFEKAIQKRLRGAGRRLAANNSHIRRCINERLN
jgi:hypothetical protein